MSTETLYDNRHNMAFIENFQPLLPEQEARLIHDMYQAPSPDARIAARMELLRWHAPLIRPLAIIGHNNSGIPLTALTECNSQSMVTAFNIFDAEKHGALTPWIRTFMKSAQDDYIRANAPMADNATKTQMAPKWSCPSIAEHTAYCEAAMHAAVLFLTPREKDVFTGISRRMTLKELALASNLSPEQVRTTGEVARSKLRQAANSALENLYDDVSAVDDKDRFRKTPEILLEQKEEVRLLQQILSLTLSAVSERDRTIFLACRFGKKSDVTRVFSTMKLVYGLNQEQVRKIDERVFKEVSKTLLAAKDFAENGYEKQRPPSARGAKANGTEYSMR